VLFLYQEYLYLFSLFITQNGSVSSEHQGSAIGIYGGICENTGIMTGAFSVGFVWNIFGTQATF